jgi:hypothetical protein
MTPLSSGRTTDMTDDSVSVAYEDLQVVAHAVALHRMPGSGEADRVAHVKRLLEASADLSYAASIYVHRVLGFTRRRPSAGDVLDETAALHDALEAFSRQVRRMADAYRTIGLSRGDGTREPTAS